MPGSRESRRTELTAEAELPDRRKNTPTVRGRAKDPQCPSRSCSRTRLRLHKILLSEWIGFSGLEGLTVSCWERHPVAIRAQTWTYQVNYKDLIGSKGPQTEQTVLSIPIPGVPSVDAGPTC